jgi:hypothetical protein
MPRSISIQTLDDQIKAAEKALEHAKKALEAGKEAKKAELDRLQRSYALKIGYLALSFGLKASTEEEMAETEAFLKTFAHKTA